MILVSSKAEQTTLLLLFLHCLECKAKIDIGFLVDSSGSIEKAGKGNYKKCLNFIKTAVNGSFISETFTHVGLVVFSSKVCSIPNFSSDIDITEVMLLKFVLTFFIRHQGIQWRNQEFFKRGGGGGGDDGVVQC